jgi:hypothetical protein
MVVSYRALSAQSTVGQRRCERVTASVVGAAQQARLFVEAKSIFRVRKL